MSSPLLTHTATADHKTCPTLHLPRDHHGPLGNSDNRPRLCQERQKPDCLQTTGWLVRSRDVPWVPLPDFLMVQEIRAAVAVQPLLLVFDSGRRVQRVARVRHCEYGWSLRI
jgi:hypothetical protein